MTKITLEQVQETTRAVLAEFGADHEYRSPSGDGSCYYAIRDEGARVVGEEPKPGCLVGQIVYRLDREVFDKLLLAEDPVTEHHYSDGEIIREAFEGVAVSALFAAQGIQDSGQPWGEAAARILDREGVTA